MTLGDWRDLAVGIATLYFLWQQNQIFKRQNDIFARQEGVRGVESPRRQTWLTIHWPLLAMTALAVFILSAVGYDRYVAYPEARLPNLSTSLYLCLLLILLCALGYVILARRHDRDQYSKIITAAVGESIKLKAQLASTRVDSTRPLPSKLPLSDTLPALPDLASSAVRDETPIPDSEVPTFQNTRKHFMELSFSQRWALKKVLQSPGQRYPDLLASLSAMGFAHADTDVGQLFYRDLAEQQTNGSVVPSVWVVKFETRLFKEFPLS